MIKFLLLISVIAVLTLEDAMSADFTNPYDVDSEYEMDIFQNFFHPDWIFDWEKSESGFRATGGSLNIRHIYNFQEAKFKFPCINERFWFKFHYERDQFLDYEINESAIEMEYSPLPKIYLSWILEPELQKGDIDTGFALAYGGDEAHRIRLDYVLVDFDKNYAFRNKSVNEGFEEFYNTSPREWRLNIKNIGETLKLFANGRYQTPGELKHIDTAGGVDDYLRKTEEWDVEFEVFFQGKMISPGLRFNAYWTRDDLSHTPDIKSEDRLRDSKRIITRPYLLIEPGGRFEYLFGGSFIDRRSEDEYPLGIVATKHYSNREIMPFAVLYYGLSEKTTVEFGYIHDSIMEEQEFNGITSFSGMRRENRLRAAVDFRFSDTVRMKLVAGIELDKEDFGRFAYFDGGYFQFQGLF